LHAAKKQLKKQLLLISATNRLIVQIGFIKEYFLNNIFTIARKTNKLDLIISHYSIISLI